MELDETQALEFEDADSTEEQGVSFKKKEVAKLKVFSQQGLQETLFPIFEGDNFIGRQKCDVNIPAKALSKKHACIEVHGDLHLVHDCESKNKTRKEKAFLKPLVRYELKHGNMLTLADIKCQFIVGDDLVEDIPDESGSETGSESVLPTDVSNEQELNLEQRIVYAGRVDKPSNNQDSDVPSDDLQPTQNYLHMKHDKSEAGEVYAADTESDTDEDTPPQVPHKTDMLCDSDGESSGVPKGKKTLADSTLPQKTIESQHSEDIRPVVLALLYSSDEEEPDNRDETSPQVNSEDKQPVLCSTSDSGSETAKFKAPPQTLLCDSDEEKPDSPFKFRRPMGYDSSTDEDSFLVVKPKFTDASVDEHAFQQDPATPAHSTSSRDSRRSSMGLAPTLILSPESEESSIYPHPPWLASDVAAEEGPRDSPLASPQGSPAQGEQEEQESEDRSGAGGEAEDVCPAEEQTDPEATQAYALSGNDETDDEICDEHLDDGMSAANLQEPSSEIQAGTVGDTNDDNDSYGSTPVRGTRLGTESFEVNRNTDDTDQKTQAYAMGDDDTDDENYLDPDDKNNLDQSPGVLASCDEMDVEADEPTVACDLEATQAYRGYDCASDRSSPVMEQSKADMEEMHFEDQPTVAYGLGETQAYGADVRTSSQPTQLAAETEESDPCEATQAYGIDETHTDEEQETDDDEYIGSSKGNVDQTEFVAETQDMDSPQPPNESHKQTGTIALQSDHEMDEPDEQDIRAPEINKQTASFSDLPTHPVSPVIPEEGISQIAEDSEEECISRRPQRKSRRKPFIVESQDVGSDECEDQVEAEETKEPAIKPKRPTRGRVKRQEKNISTDTVTAEEEIQNVVKETPEIGRRKGRGRGKTSQQAMQEMSTDTVTAEEEIQNVVKETPEIGRRKGRGRGKTSQQAMQEMSTDTVTAEEEKQTVVKETPEIGRRKGRGRGRTSEQAMQEMSTHAVTAEEEIQTVVKETPEIGRTSQQAMQEMLSVESESVEKPPAVIVPETPATTRRKGKKSRMPEVTAEELLEQELSLETPTIVEETPAVNKRKGKRHQAAVESRAVAESPGLLDYAATPAETPAAADRPRRGGRGKKVQEATPAGPQPTPSSESQTRKGRGRRTQKSAEPQASGTIEPGSSGPTPQAKVGAIRGKNSQGEETATLEPEPGDVSQTRRGKSKRKPWVENAQEKTQASQDVDNSQTRTTRGKGRQVRKTETTMIDSPPSLQASEHSEQVETEDVLSPKSGKDNTRRKRGRPTIEESSISSETPEFMEESLDLESSSQGTSAQKGRARRGKTPSKTPDNSQDVTQATPAKKTRKLAATAGSPSLRIQVESRPKVMFTGLEDKQSEKIVKSLGGVLVDRVHDCTHLVTDKVRRTVKFLCGVGGGQKIVQPSWLEACKKAKAFVDSSPFLVKDRAAEKQFNFSLQRSHQLALDKGLLEGYKVHVTKSVKPDPTQMKDIIQCAKGQFLSTLPRASDDGVLVISCEQDRIACGSAIAAGIPVCSAELLLSGILKQELNIEEHQLFTDETGGSQESQSGRGKRKRGESNSASPATSSASATKTTKRKRR